MDRLGSSAAENLRIASLKTDERMTDMDEPSAQARAQAFRFAMPRPVRITGRSSSITNSFISGIVPVVRPTEAQINEALEILGMSELVVCSYCGDTASEWDHLRALVVGQQPTGYIHEIHNLVPACGKCNQSKGNRPWREWMFGTARHSPANRGVADLQARAERLERYERWGNATRVDFPAVVGEELWSKHWRNHTEILALMREAEETVELIRARVAEASAAATQEALGRET